MSSTQCVKKSSEIRIIIIPDSKWMRVRVVCVERGRERVREVLLGGSSSKCQRLFCTKWDFLLLSVAKMAPYSMTMILYFFVVSFVSLHSCLCVCVPQSFWSIAQYFNVCMPLLMAANDERKMKKKKKQYRSLYSIHAKLCVPMCVCARVCVRAFVFCLSVDNPC